ncbi:hypothetical protein [Halalkalibacter akibai]|uniref:Uncharacterized protein n=1 Tax=Halalkalibacter akibai (strain ATCC 43226 / DSM 21942 / CIP 109018 / JCM 9157 / 1139) TaxID=1236973 RepID=W4R0S7_HALA3|nr:hypothetical protein [Halalkalibacter akibai]GAE37164.1 hypothetical protein JCM9157_4421 [Halalkalibacter akibai JCM 9157]
MGLDPQAKLFLDLMKQQNTPALDQLSIEENRNLNKKLTTFGGQPERVNKVEDVVIPVREGQITLRLYTLLARDPFLFLFTTMAVVGF